MVSFMRHRLRTFVSVLLASLLDDLFRKSFQAMASSWAIREFAAARQSVNMKGL